MSLMGVDIGSTGAKAVVFNADGQVLAQSYQEYDELHPRPGFFELDPQQVWEAFVAVTGEAAATCREPVQALAISAQGEAFVPVDEHGEFLYGSILSYDGRAEQQVRQLAERLGERQIFQITGMPIHPSFTLPKLMWLRDNEPQVHAATHKYLLWPDVICCKLGLPVRLDWSLAGRTMAFDITKRSWSEPVLEAAGISPELLAEPIRPGEVIGQLPANAAQLLGLSTECVVVAGGHDQPMNALGAGIIGEGLAVDGMGTVECVTVAFTEPVLTEAMLSHGYCCYPHVAGDMYVSLAFNYSSGSLLRWFRDNFAEADRIRAAEQGRDVYEIILEGLPDGPTGLLVVPYFAGAGTPYMDARARGTMVGMTSATDRKSFIKALLEGVCLDLRLNLESLKQAGVEVSRLRATGGGSKSPYWLQLKADITGRQVVTINVVESGCQAGAILGGVATGVYESLQQAVEWLVHEQVVYEPRPAMYESYQHYFQLYQQLWPAVREIVHQL